MLNKVRLPPFPAKVFSNMDPSIVSERKFMLENWLQACACKYKLVPYVIKFLKLPLTTVSPPPLKVSPLTKAETIITDFVRRINEENYRKISAIEDFEWEFLWQRTTVREELFLFLVNSLVKLCGDNSTGAKSMDILTKLISRDTCKNYLTVLKQLVQIQPQKLQVMRLNDHLMNRIHGESQPQAFKVIKVLADHYRSQNEDIYLFIIVRVT